MGQACCADDIQVEYNGNIINEQSMISKKESVLKNDPILMNVPT